jgi:hypothetical protein
MDTTLPYWLQNLVIRGREEDDGGSGGAGGEGDDDDDDGEEEEDEEGKGGSGSEEDQDDPDARIAALEEALTNERKLRRKIERESKRKLRQKSTDKQNKDDQELQEQLQASTLRTQKLAEGLLRKEIESAVVTEARNQGFIDPTDALVSMVLDEIDAEQDEDDPTDIDIDPTSVVDAVKELARRKKHLVGESKPGEKSGSRFRKKGNQSDDEYDEAALQGNYPSLRV